MKILCISIILLFTGALGRLEPQNLERVVNLLGSNLMILYPCNQSEWIKKTVSLFCTQGNVSALLICINSRPTSEFISPNTFNFVVLVDDLDQLYFDVTFTRRVIRNPNGKMVIMLPPRGLRNNAGGCKEVIEIVWSTTGISNIHTWITYNTNNEYCFWSPYQLNNCGKVENIIETKEFPEHISVSEVRDLNFCHITYTGYNLQPLVTKLDFTIFKIISNFINANPVYVSSTSTDSMDLHTKRRIDVTFTSMIHDVHDQEWADPSIPLRLDHVAWLLPEPDPVPWDVLFHVFTKELWTYFLVTQLMILITIVLSGYIRKKKINMPLEFIQMFLTIPSKNLPKVLYRPIYLIFLLCGYILTSIYQKSLVPTMLHYNPSMSYTTVQEFEDDGFTESWVNKFQDSVPDTPKFLDFRHEDFHSTLKQLATHSNSSALSLSSFSEYWINRDFLDSEQQITILKTNPVVIPLYFSPNNPLREVFNKNILRFQESGMTHFLYEKVVQHTVRQKPQRQLQCLTIMHLLGAFIILLVGHTLACISFVYEKLHKRELHLLS